MTRHLLRLIWNRKRQNFLLTAEIFFSFLALFGVVLFAVQYANNARLPLGYSVERLWSLHPDPKEPEDDPEVKARHRETYRQLVLALRDLPEIEAVAAGFAAPYTNSSWGGEIRLRGGRKLDMGLNRVTDDYPALLQMPLVAGRWFSREDDAATYTPVVLNRRMAREIFGDGTVVGQIIHEERDPDGPPPDPNAKPEIKRVVGVFEDFRQMGELSSPENFLFYRMRLDDPDPAAATPDIVVVRVRPGTTAAFEETLIKRAMAVAHNWSFEVQPFDAMRENKLRQYKIPLMVVGTVAGFLLLMVALGLTGVVWQSVTQRIREFGLRRAKGATAVNVQRQVLIEMVLMTSLALIVGVLLVAQLPLLPIPDKIGIIPPRVFVTSIALSVGAIYLLTLLCGWYPSRLATKVQPAEALHYE
jgi:putative ABC transport system permease protein